MHKHGVPIRPIVLCSGSSLYSLNKYIANILKIYVKDENNNAMNSTTFSNSIRDFSIKYGEIMVLFDVISLDSNIPIIDTLNIIKDYVDNDDQFTNRIAITQDKFLVLVDLVLRTSWYTFKSQFYQQSNSAWVGGSASSTRISTLPKPLLIIFSQIFVFQVLSQVILWHQFQTIFLNSLDSLTFF